MAGRPVPPPSAPPTPGGGRRFWLLLAISVAALVLSGLALGIVLTRAPPGPTTVYSGTFVEGTIGRCGEILGWAGYCDMINLTLPGGNTSDRFVLLEVTLNRSCPPSCFVTLGSYPQYLRTSQGVETQDLNRSANTGGVVWGGADFLQVGESSSCGASKPPCPPLEASIQVEDYGPVPK